MPESRSELPVMENVDDIYPLTSAQEGMLFHTVSEPNSGVYVEQVDFYLDGRVEPELLQEAWERALERHGILRTAFLWEGLDQPLQVVRSQVELPWESLDWSALPPKERAQSWKRLLRDDRQVGFELLKAPLLRLRCLRFSRDAWRLLITFHHILLDGWSFHDLLHEVLNDYQALLNGSSEEPRERPDFRELVAVRQSFSPPGEELYWTRMFEGFEAPRLRAAEERSGGEFLQSSFLLDDEQTEALVSLCQASRVTLNTLLQALWAHTLALHYGCEDLSIGLALSGRTEMEEAERILGPLLNVLPIRMKVPRERSLQEWLPELQAQNVALQDFQLSKLSDVQHWAGASAENPLFESLLVFENYPSHDTAWADFEMSGLAFREQSNFPLALLVVPGSYLRCLLLLDSSRLHASLLDSLETAMKQAVKAVLERPTSPLGTLALVNPEECEKLQAWGTGQELNSPLDVLDSFLESVAESPDHWALITSERRMSYEELDIESNRLASALQEKGVEAGARVGIYLDRSVEFVVSVLAVWKVGAAYVPLSRRHPYHSLQWMLEEAQVKLVLTLPELLGELPVESGAYLSPRVATSAPGKAVRVPGEEAYVLYTSGSTGRPKGVLVSRDNLAASTAARTLYFPAKIERFLLLSSPVFDSSVAGLFGTLAQGGTLILPAEGQEREPREILALISEHKVTHTLCLPSLWQTILEEADPFQVSSLRCVSMAGEACPSDLVGEHYGLMPEATLYNEYGPTEATVWSSVFQVPEDWSGSSLPIGGPIPGTCLEVQDPAGRLVPTGLIGELVIKGLGVARYLSSQEEQGGFVHLGERAYRSGDLVSWRADGTLRFEGRLDRQLKVRGFRVEASAVEATLAQLDGVQEVAVHSPDGRRLIAYVVGRSSEEELRERAARDLPDYAVPTQVEYLSEIPRTVSGKVDRSALPEPGRAVLGHVPPASPEEETMSAIWSEVLGFEPVGRHDNFFELGGDSIMAIRIVSKARTAGLQVSPNDLLSEQTIAELFRDKDQRASREGKELEESFFPLVPIQSWLVERGLRSLDHWNLGYWFSCSQPLDGERLKSAFAQLVERHDALRLQFRREPAGWSQRVQQRGSSPKFSVLVVPEITEAEKRRIEEGLQGGFCLEEGTLFAGVLLQDEQRQELFLVGHHLVLDDFSWSLILAELEGLYLGQERKRPLACFQEWAEVLPDRSQGSELKRELPQWLAQQASATLPLDFPEGSNTEAEVGVWETSLTDPGLGGELQARLLTALGRAICLVFRMDSLSIGLENHGRIDPDFDLSETVGWFSSYFPFRYQECEDSLQRAQAFLRELPRGGRDYGLLRYLTREPSLQDFEPQVLLNYLGRREGREEGLFQRLGGLSPLSRHPREERLFPFEILVSSEGDRLEVQWRYGSQLHRRETVEALGQAFLDFLVQSESCDHVNERT